MKGPLHPVEPFSLYEASDWPDEKLSLPGLRNYELTQQLDCQSLALK